MKPNFLIWIQRFLILVLIISLSSCSSFQAPTAPSDLKAVWLATPPCAVVQPTAEATEAYKVSIPPLGLKYARVGIDPAGQSRTTLDIISSNGIEIIGVVSNCDLLSDNLEVTLDRIFAVNYPQVRIFQMGNEVTDQAIKARGNCPMQILDYVHIFKRAYTHVLNKYPGIILMTESTVGSGGSGANELAYLYNQALFNMDKSRVYIGVNVYTGEALVSYASLVSSKLSGFRIWVTETGYNDWDGQVSHVLNFYPDLRDGLRPMAICHYVLWGGDKGEKDSSYGLIDGVKSGQLQYSPLYLALTAK